jgi:type II secretory pathway pseudopilin PulG
MNAPTANRAGRAAGFTLVEALVALGVTAILILGVLALFDLNNRITRVQLQVADMQQSLRVAQQIIVRDTRMSGRGGLPPGRMPGGVAFAMRNDSGAGGGSLDVALGWPDSPQVEAGSDVLIVRGVFSSPVYQINHIDPTSFVTEQVGGACFATLRVDALSHTGVDQSLAPLKEVVEDEVPEALMLVSPLDDALFAIAELIPTAPTDISDDDSYSLRLQFTGGTNTAAYNALSPPAGCPPLTRVGFAGILEEYRYYIRNDTGTAGQGTLSRAQVFPGTEVPHGDDPANLSVDIADNIVDLQLALGLDTDGDEVLVDDGGQNDEWLFNHTADNPGAVVWNNARIGYVRINTLARTGRVDPDYVSPPLVAIEDHLYSEPVTPATQADREARMHRRRLLQTVVDLRNLT